MNRLAAATAIAAVAFVGLGGISALTTATENTSTSGGSAVGDLTHPSRVVHSSGNDVSAPLRELEAAEGEREGERADPDRPDPDRPDPESGDPDRADPDRPAGNAPQRVGDVVQPPFRRPYLASRAALPHQPDGSLQRTSSGGAAAAMPAPIRSFDGIASTQSPCGCYPPDTNSAVGPNHIVETVNTAIAVYDKTGVIRTGFPKPLNALWSGFTSGPQCRDNNDGDPVVVYDQLANRFLVSQFAIPGFINGSGYNYQCIAVSATGDPTGAWNRYQFGYPAGLLNDYPKFGVWPDGYYATYNNFTSPAGQFAGAGIASYDRAKMLAGQPANVVQFNLPASTNEGGLLPASLDGATLPPVGAPNPIVEMQDTIFGFAHDQIMIRRFHVNFAHPTKSTLSAPKLLRTTPFDSNLCNLFFTCVPQKGTSVKLDALSDRVMFRASYRNFGSRDSLLINSTVDATGGDVAAIRWAEVRRPTTYTASIVQQGTYAPDATHRWMASIAQDRDGNIAMGYSASSSTLNPSLRYVGRLAADPPGVMTQGETTLFAGTGSQTGTAGRWGDYSSLVLDPTDDCTFWYSSEYYATTSSTSWRTRIGSFKFPSCTP